MKFKIELLKRDNFKFAIRFQDINYTISEIKKYCKAVEPAFKRPL